MNQNKSLAAFKVGPLEKYDLSAFSDFKEIFCIEKHSNS